MRWDKIHPRQRRPCRCFPRYGVAKPAVRHISTAPNNGLAQRLSENPVACWFHQPQAPHFPCVVEQQFPNPSHAHRPGQSCLHLVRRQRECEYQQGKLATLSERDQDVPQRPPFGPNSGPQPAGCLRGLEHQLRPALYALHHKNRLAAVRGYRALQVQRHAKQIQRNRRWAGRTLTPRQLTTVPASFSRCNSFVGCALCAKEWRACRQRGRNLESHHACWRRDHQREAGSLRHRRHQYRHLQSGQRYDLQGRPVGPGYRGIYIQDGRKYIA